MPVDVERAETAVTVLDALLRSLETPPRLARAARVSPVETELDQDRDACETHVGPMTFFFREDSLMRRMISVGTTVMLAFGMKGLVAQARPDFTGNWTVSDPNAGASPGIMYLGFAFTAL